MELKNLSVKDEEVSKTDEKYARLLMELEKLFVKDERVSEIDKNFIRYKIHPNQLQAQSPDERDWVLWGLIEQSINQLPQNKLTLFDIQKWVKPKQFPSLLVRDSSRTLLLAYTEYCKKFDDRTNMMRKSEEYPHAFSRLRVFKTTTKLMNESIDPFDWWVLLRMARESAQASPLENRFSV
ncbi:MAG: hypothetical protein M1840_005363 [Geoglossum simile]|nr:MAG: hypothetical protein M1840_005363 [Geoglossum simile]